MNSNEMLVIVGGLFFGYLIVTYLLNPKKTKPSGQSENSNSSQNKSEDTNSQKENESSKSSQHSSYKQSSAKDEYVPASWFRILEVSESASLSQISVQYKRKIREYHPDKVASLGKELRELAEFKSKEINSAYDLAKKLKS